MCFSYLFLIFLASTSLSFSLFSRSVHFFLYFSLFYISIFLAISLFFSPSRYFSSSFYSCFPFLIISLNIIFILTFLANSLHLSFFHLIVKRNNAICVSPFLSFSHILLHGLSWLSGKRLGLVMFFPLSISPLLSAFLSFFLTRFLPHSFVFFFSF